MTRRSHSNWKPVAPRPSRVPKQPQVVADSPALAEVNQGSKAEWAMVRLTRFTTALTLVTAACAIGATIFSAQQLAEMRQDSKNAEALIEAANMQAEAALVSAKAAGKSAEAATNQVEILERSVVIAKESGLPRIDFAQSLTDVEVGKAPLFSVIAKNSGQQPARSANLRMMIGIHPHPISGGVFSKVLPQPPSLIPATIRPVTGTLSAAVRLSRTLTEEDMKSIRDGKSAIYIYGYLEYLDVSNIQHRVHTCSSTIFIDGVIQPATCDTPLDY